MSKLSQLIRFDALGIPTPAFTAVSYDDFRLDKYREDVARLTFPVIVRSSFSDEDGDSQSHAGAFLSLPDIESDGLFEAIDKVFQSYPTQEGQEVIIQEMISAEYSGVLFAFQDAVWKLEYGQGAGAVVGGEHPSKTLLLPKFSRGDIFWSRLLKVWSPDLANKEQDLKRPFIGLSVYAAELLNDTNHQEAGLDIEFAVADGAIYILQARPITTASEREEILSSANHKEILPPIPSPFMSGMIASCSRHLFSYYQRLDPSLRDRSFIELAEGMPWINMSALLDIMVKWGLPTNLVTRSVGTHDVYAVRTRPYAAIKHLSVFLKVLRDQLTVIGRTRSWVAVNQKKVETESAQRTELWRSSPDIAFNNWLTQLQLVYVGLVDLMQAHTGAMSGPARFLEKWGVLQYLEGKDPSLDYFHQFRKLSTGETTRSAFLEEFGHRGFYESDIGQPRFAEYTEATWSNFLADGSAPTKTSSSPNLWMKMVGRLLDPVTTLISSRESLRNEAMKMFQVLRTEMLEQTRILFGDQFDFSLYHPDTLSQGIEMNWGPGQWKQVSYPEPSGWDMDVFLANRSGRRIPLDASKDANSPIGVFPGIVRGQIWKVDHASVESLEKPDFDSTILLTESLDPGWIPYFVKVDGVLSYVGGILSHASIILRESGMPAITQVSRAVSLNTGDWVEMDGKTGLVRKISPTM